MKAEEIIFVTLDQAKISWHQKHNPQKEKNGKLNFVKVKFSCSVKDYKWKEKTSN